MKQIFNIVMLFSSAVSSLTRSCLAIFARVMR